MRYPTGKTALYAILAHPLAHVRAPEFLNPIIEAEGRDGFLVGFHVTPEDLGGLIRQLRAIRNLGGFIVTIPHKAAMARLCDELGPVARLVGTVNTVRMEADGRLVGEMFDGVGLIDGARANGIEPTGHSVLLVGAGGAGRAIAFALAEAGATRLVVANRTAETATALVTAVQAAFPACEVRAGPADARGVDIVIQATSLGLHADDPLPVDPATFEPATSLFEIIAVRDTELMQAVAARGCKVVGGRPMVEYQARAQIAFLAMPPPP